ncbi:MAG TPA: histidinol dehydrogenase [Longimicrobiales bacterium]|nr:histidinol dehydrogenase [Longimicrobiales bacterium]
MSMPTVDLLTGTIGDLTARDRHRLFDRGRATDPAVERAVRDIIAEVRATGDAALREQAARFDGVQLSALEVPREACMAALESLNGDVRAALELAAHNIETFHRAQLAAPLEVEMMPGLRLGRRAEPLRSVGVYAPGGRAAYPSSVLMGVVPAKVAGVGEVVVCSPAGSDGLPPEAVLAACALAGADRVFAIGGAGAIAALALGTVSVPRVDKIVGPGNAYVTEAKRQLTGTVAIDSPAGPSEILIIADDTADATLVAVELLAQAEHDPDAAAVLVATDASLIDRVASELDRLLADQPRADIIRAALAARGALLTAATLDDAMRFAGGYAPEHLLIMTRDPRALLPSIRSAGTIFLGAPSSVAFGDYITGANHVLPTAGLARAYAGLSSADFVRWTTYQELTPAAAAAVAGPTAVLADAEGLPGHALAARLRGGVSRGSDGRGTETRGAEVGRAETYGVNARAEVAPVRLREAYASLTPYDPGRLPCAVDLSDNTNLFGPAPGVRRVLDNAADPLITRYPSVYADELRRAIADLHGVAPENIATGCGSDDVIDSALRAFCEPGDSVAYPDPTFGMVPVFGRMNALKPAAVPLRQDFALDADALLATDAGATYLCRPNNPTGTQFERAAMARVCQEAAGVVLIDEAYADFADDDFVQHAIASDRTLVLRTFSKAYGLAGLRVGYAVGPARLIAEVEKSRGPYKVGGVAQAAALAALRDGAWVADRIAEVRTNRARLRAELEARGTAVWESAANFLLTEIPGSAGSWNTRLRERGVAVRPFSALTGAGECIRVSIGPWDMMQQFLDAFDEVLNTMAGNR